jgi:uncharacterized NAD(P)/FAD-binding protein YdhS
VAAQLLRNGFAGRIFIVEARESLGRGLAYSTAFDQHLLNVPAEKMSAFPDRPLHFLDWLRARTPACPAVGFFAPRKVYGEYLEDVLGTESTVHGEQNCRHIRGEVTRVEETSGGLQLMRPQRRKEEKVRVVSRETPFISDIFPTFQNFARTPLPRSLHR